MELGRQITDAVASLINGHPWGVSFAAARQYSEDWTKDDLAILRCYLGQGPRQSERINRRGDTRETSTVDVVLMKVLAAPTATLDLVTWKRTTMDTISDLIEAIVLYLRGASLPGLAGVVWTATQMVPGAEAGYVQEYFGRHSVATVLRRLTYKTVLRVPR